MLFRPKSYLGVARVVLTLATRRMFHRVLFAPRSGEISIAPGAKRGKESSAGAKCFFRPQMGFEQAEI
jgi:hypothetical protein